jgi:hypothetical protein
MSTKSIAEKLLIKPGTAVWSSDQGRLELIGPLPQDVRVVETLGEATTAILFGDDAASLRAIVAAQGARLGEPETVWVAYPKANRTDINRDSAWPILAEYGMRPIGQVAIDDVWSALRFRPLKSGEEPFTGGAGS